MPADPLSQSGGNVYRFLTPSDLAERWQCSVLTALKRVREGGIPILWIGSGEPSLAGRGRALVRFRPDAVERWEAEQEQRRESEQEGPAVTLCVRVQGLARGQRAWVPD